MHAFIYDLDPFTCHEIKLMDPDSKSGIYQIDPTGPLDGDTLPIDVYCDLDSNFGNKCGLICLYN